MKKVLVMLCVVGAMFSCKKETQPTIVGQNEQGQDLIVNAEGDTVVYQPETKTNETEEVTTPKSDTAFEKDAEGNYTFHFNLEKGKTYPFSISTESSMVQSDGKQSQSGKQSSITALDYTVTDVKKDSYVFDVKFTRFKEAMNDGKQSISYDTNEEKPTNEIAAQQWEFNKAMVGKTFSMEVSKEGKVLDVTKLLTVRNAVKEELSKDLSPEEKEGLNQILNQSLSVEAMQSMFEESISYYPKKAVKVDETWTKKEGNDKASSSMDYTFKGIEDNQALISIKGKSTGNDSQTNQQGVKLFRSLEGNVTGDIKIDAKSGWLTSAEIKKEEVIRMTQQYQGQKMNFSSTTNTTTTIN